jgi:ABC-type transporter Mla subunit MlaD
MPELIKELGKVAGELSQLILNTTDPEERTILMEKYLTISQQMENAAHQQFQQNDAFFVTVIQQIKKTEKEIQQYNARQTELFDLFKSLSQLVESVFRLCLGWK